MVSTPRDFSSFKPGDRVGHAFGLVAPGFGIVLQDLGGHDEDVLVHQRHAEICGIDCSAGSVQVGHSADAKRRISDVGPLPILQALSAGLALS